MNLKETLIGRSGSLKIRYDDSQAITKLEKRLKKLMPIDADIPVVTLCIGTDRSTGDALGPIVGSKLKQKIRDLPIYGSLEDPVHAMNLEKTIATLNRKYPDAFIIAVDACLGQLKNVGTISLAEGPVKPGAGVHKRLPSVGDVHFSGIVNVGGMMEYFVLQNTRLSLVMKMADVIADSLARALSANEKRPFSRFRNHGAAY